MAAKLEQCIIFYDGNCGLCSRSVRWLHFVDEENRFLFAPLEGQTFRQYSLTHRAEHDSFLLLRLADQQVFSKSRAWIVILQDLGYCGKFLAGLLSLMPQYLLDAGYNLIAKNRRRLLPAHDLCSIPDQNLQKKLLP